MSSAEKRQHPRVQFVTRVTNTLSGVTHYYYSRDISLGGMFLDTHKPYPMETTVALEFALEGIDEKLRVTGRVVRVVEPDAKNPSRTAGMGLSFTALTEASRKQLLAFLLHKIDLAGP